MLETLLKADDVAERCGLVLKNGDVLELPNIALDPVAGFEMDPVEALKHLDDAIGSWHTHPSSDPTLSGDDHDFFVAWPDWVHAIIGRRDGKVLVLRYYVEDGLAIECD